jgi:hypothetical protein
VTRCSSRRRGLPRSCGNLIIGKRIAVQVKSVAQNRKRYNPHSHGRRTTKAERPAIESSLLCWERAPADRCYLTRMEHPGDENPPSGVAQNIPPFAQAAVCVVSPDDCNGSDSDPNVLRASNFAFGREARLRGSTREGPESAPKPPFHREREIGFTARRRSSDGRERLTLSGSTARLRLGAT